MYPDDNMNGFTWSKEDNGFIVPGDQYNEEFKKWQGPIHNGQFRSHALKEKRKTENNSQSFQAKPSLI